jgi:hypothetical protein
VPDAVPTPAPVARTTADPGVHAYVERVDAAARLRDELLGGVRVAGMAWD